MSDNICNHYVLSPKQNSFCLSVNRTLSAAVAYLLSFVFNVAFITGEGLKVITEDP